MFSARLLALCLAATCLCSYAAEDPAAAAAADIDKANQDWAVAMVHGDAATAAAAYMTDAVFCDTAGNCTRGRDAIEKLTQARLQEHGLPRSAAAHSERRVAADGFVYEWGEASLVTSYGKTDTKHFLTVWQRQDNGHWLIYRNLVLP